MLVFGGLVPPVALVVVRIQDLRMEEQVGQRAEAGYHQDNYRPGCLSPPEHLPPGDQVVEQDPGQDPMHDSEEDNPYYPIGGHNPASRLITLSSLRCIIAHPQALY